jgi:hypothetical protein
MSADVPVTDELLELAQRLVTLPDGSLLALTMYGPGERSLVVQVTDGAIAVPGKLDVMPTAAVAFPASELSAMLADPGTAQRLSDDGKLRPRGNPELSRLALHALGVTATPE